MIMKTNRALIATATAALWLAGRASAADPARAEPKPGEVEALRAEVKRLAAEVEAVKAKPAAADAPAQVAERLDLVEERQKDAVVVGDVPGSFRVLGTELSLKLYGYVEVNYIHEFKGDNSDIDIPAFPAYAPLRDTPDARRTNRDFITARTSRFGVDASSPTRFGALAAKLEGDFINEPRTGGTEQYGTYRNVITQQETSSYGFRVRHAYGSFAGLLVGQTWGTFMDVDNSPETIDYNGPPGSTIIRQPMIRYSYATQSLGKFTVALENSSSYVLGDSAQADADLPMRSSLSRLPDVVLRWDGSYEWGNVSVRALEQEFRVKDGNGVDATKVGWGGAATAFLKMRGGQDFLSLALTGGEGIGRYLFYVEGAVYDTPANEIRLERAGGIVAGYQFKPTSWVRCNFVYGITRTFDNDYVDVIRANGFDSGRFGINRQVQQAHVGAIFTPFPGVDLGVEGIWGQRKTLAGEHGDVLRYNFLARYYIN